MTTDAEAERGFKGSQNKHENALENLRHSLKNRVIGRTVAVDERDLRIVLEWVEKKTFSDRDKAARDRIIDEKMRRDPCCVWSE